MSSVGVYALFVSMAASREREIGVRIALGATRGGIATLILREGGVWMVVGLTLGAIGVMFAGRFLRTQLFGVPELDPIAISGAMAVLVACATLALRLRFDAPRRWIRSRCFDSSGARSARATDEDQISTWKS